MALGGLCIISAEDNNRIFSSREACLGILRFVSHLKSCDRFHPVMVDVPTHLY